jgi:hypothetical protein
MQEGLAVDYSRVEVENCVPFSTCPAGQVICPIRFSTCREGWAVPTSVFYQVAGTGTMQPWNRPTEGTREEGKGQEGCIEYTSLINIRPSQGNRGMEVTDPAIREQIREITLALIGEGEPLE